MVEDNQDKRITCVYFCFVYSISIMVVRMRHTKSHTANRRSHHALKAPKIVTDAATGSVRLNHRIDMTTGMYKGRKVIDVVAKVSKKQAKTATKK